MKRVSIGPDEICSFVIGDACGDVYNPYHEWEVAFPPMPKPAVKTLEPPLSGAPTFKVLHISDTHYDPYYAEGKYFSLYLLRKSVIISTILFFIGSNADCNEPLCCRLTNGPAASPGAGAGKWGDYRKCDTPKRTVDHMLKHIADTHTVSY